MVPHKGLSVQGVLDSRKSHGANIITAEKKRGFFGILGTQFRDILTIILLLAAFISFVGGHIGDGFVIVVIVFLNSFIATIQEYRSESTLEALTKMINPTSRVIRDGSQEMIANTDIVVGDIINLSEGDRIPADAKILEAFGLSINESALTGESVPVIKTKEDLVFMGTGVAKGNAYIEVVSVGMQTKFGQIARLSTTAESALSPLQKEILHIGHFVAKVTGVISLLLFVLGMYRGQSFVESLMFAAATAIAAVPEGLPTTITIALALGATVLLRKKALVKKLSAVETLGAVTTICSDKTGTLTQNQMTVERILLPGVDEIMVTGSGYEPDGSVKVDDAHIDHLTKLVEVMTFANEARYTPQDGGSILGDPTEGALLVLAHKISYEDRREQDRLGILPFDSVRKLMSAYTSDMLYTKGSPDALIDRCDRILTSDGVREMLETDRDALRVQNLSFAQRAYRVLAAAYRERGDERIPIEDTDECGMVFVGLVAIIDPPREEVCSAIQTAYDAGVRVIVITGDNGHTARAIGQAIGLESNNHSISIHEGSDVSAMSDVDLRLLLADRSKALIFARSMPEQKMRIVEILQGLGEVVAMTGDGVNDAPALKKSNIGVAMGITGTEVSKEASSLVLLDDSFTTIVTAIAEGRRIYANLKKCIWFVFSCNIAELFLVLGTILTGLPIALTAILILCIDLGTDILPAVALGVDQGNPSDMQRPPRSSHDRILKKSFVLHFVFTGLLIGGCVMSVFVLTLLADGWSYASGSATEYHPHAIVMAFATLVVIQLVNMLSARSLTESVVKNMTQVNWLMILSWLVGLGLLVCVSYVPFLNDLLHTAPLTMDDWGIIIGVSMIPLVGIEIWKYHLRHSASYMQL